MNTQNLWSSTSTANAQSMLSGQLRAVATVLLLPLIIVMTFGLGSAGAQEARANGAEAKFEELSTKVEKTSVDLTLLQARLDATKEAQAERMASLSARSDAQDKRIDTQNAHLADNLSVVGIVLTGVALVLPLAGLVGYITVRRKATGEARSVAKEQVSTWFASNESAVMEKMNQLELKLDSLERDANQNAEMHKVRIAEASALVIGRLEENLRRGADAKDPISREDSLALAESAKAADEKPPALRSFNDWNGLAFESTMRRDFSAAVEFWEQALKSSEADISTSDRLYTTFNIGLARTELGDIGDAIRAYDEVINMVDSGQFDRAADVVAQALVNRGALLSRMGRYAESISNYERVIAENTEAASSEWKLAAAKAMFNKAVVFGQTSRLEDQLAGYDELIEAFQGDEDLKLQEQVAKALNNKTILLKSMDRLGEARSAAAESVRRFRGGQAKNLHWYGVTGLATLAALSIEADGELDPIKMFDDVINDLSAFPDREETSRLLAAARNGKGYAYLCRAKKAWLDVDARRELLEKARELFEIAMSTSEDMYAVGNMAYLSHLVGGDSAVVREMIGRALWKGGKNLHAETLKDTRLYEIPGIDEAFRVIVSEEWEALHGGSDGEPSMDSKET